MIEWFMSAEMAGIRQLLVMIIVVIIGYKIGWWFNPTNPRKKK